MTDEEPATVSDPAFEPCPGSGMPVALGSKQGYRRHAGCPVCRRTIELVPRPPGQASPWGMIAEHERPMSSPDHAPPPDPWRGMTGA